MAIATVNPATGETLKTYGELSDSEIERILAAAAEAHASYRLTDFESRAGWMRRAADILDGEVDQIAAMMTTEMGKTLAASKQEVAKCASCCRLIRAFPRRLELRRADSFTIYFCAVI